MATLRAVTSWSMVGERVAEARRAAGFTQEDLAEALGVDRTAVTKIEAGLRRLDALELLGLARTLQLMPEWFVSLPPPAVVSRRAERTEGAAFEDVDALVEELARNVELLIELAEVEPPAAPAIERPVALESAEEAAAVTRRALDHPTGPLPELQRACERVGLYSFSVAVDHHGFDGAYVALERGGVALVNGLAEAGRRRFTLAHELGHHVLADEYSSDYALGEAQADTEKAISSFAIHLLMPRSSVVDDWNRFGGHERPREAMINVAALYRVSWTAACSHLVYLGALDRDEGQRLVRQPPTRGDYLESGVFLIEELVPPAVPPGFAQAVLRAFRKHKVGADRAVELLQHAISPSELPVPDRVPLDAFRGELNG